MMSPPWCHIPDGTSMMSPTWCHLHDVPSMTSSPQCHHNALGIHNGVEFHRYTPSILRSSSAKQPCDNFSKCEKGLDLSMSH
jgi:hypothetical protein